MTFHAGETAKMGSTVSRGEAEAVVTATGGDTFFGKTANMIKSVDEMGHFQKVTKLRAVVPPASHHECLCLASFTVLARIRQGCAEGTLRSTVAGSVARSCCA